MTAPERIPCAVLGASGYIGQHFVRLLADHPWFEPVLFTSSERSTGRALAEVWQLPEDPPADLGRRRLHATSAAEVAASGVRLAFSGLPSGKAKAFETELARRGVAVFSNASDHRLDPQVPLLVPEVNADHLALLGRKRRARAPIVTNPNCSATGLVVALAPILPLLRPRRVHVTTYQALSGAGYPGVPSLNITDNVVPYIASEEEKIQEESRRILGRVRSGGIRPARLPILANCARVPVRDGHLEAVTVEARHAPRQGDLARAWSRFAPLRELELPTAPLRPVIVRPEADRPQPIRDRWAGEPARARGMSAVVGRVRWDPPFLRFYLLSHNAVRGGAGGSVLNAELALHAGYLPRSRP